jgi:hypothetical protein
MVRPAQYMHDMAFTLCQLGAFRIQNFHWTYVETVYSGTDYTFPVISYCFNKNGKQYTINLLFLLISTHIFKFKCPQIVMTCPEGTWSIVGLNPIALGYDNLQELGKTKTNKRYQTAAYAASRGICRLSPLQPAAPSYAAILQSAFFTEFSVFNSLYSVFYVPNCQCLTLILRWIFHYISSWTGVYQAEFWALFIFTCHFVSG